MSSATAVRERPIPFSAPMVRALLSGTKTQTRRVMVPQPDASLNRDAREIDRFRCVGTDVSSGRMEFEAGNFAGPIYAFRDGRDSVKAGALCPYGQPGDRLWVREAIRCIGGRSIYTADDSLTRADAWPWKRDILPPMFCPRGLSRLTLEITGVRAERLQDISENDARDEGAVLASWPADVTEDDGALNAESGYFPPRSYRAGFAALWNSLNDARGYGWDANPWVWVLAFRRLA